MNYVLRKTDHAYVYVSSGIVCSSFAAVLLRSQRSSTLNQDGKQHSQSRRKRQWYQNLCQQEILQCTTCILSFACYHVLSHDMAGQLSVRESIDETFLKANCK